MTLLAIAPSNGGLLGFFIVAALPLKSTNSLSYKLSRGINRAKLGPLQSLSFLH